MTLHELSVDHPYYCSDSNYFSNEAGWVCDSMKEFLDEYEDADVSMNLIFRWDIHPLIDAQGDPTTSGGDYGMTEGYWGEIFIIGQRKGIFKPILIKDICEDDVPRLLILLNKHLEEIKNMWVPIL